MLRFNKKLLGLATLVLGFLLMVVGMAWFLTAEVPLLAPITTATRFQFLNQPTTANQQRVVYGFLPYWNLQKVVIQPELTHLAYFSLNIGSDGSIIVREDGESNLGYSRLKSDTLLELTQQMQQQNGKVTIVIAQFDNDTIDDIIYSEAAQLKMLEQLDAVLLAYPFAGVNIDFEYSGSVSQTTRDRFSQFVQRVSNHIHTKYQGVQVSIDVYASAANQEQIWDIPKIGQYVDYVVVMAYDFHRRSSPLAGPVAPLFGGKDLWSSDISMHLRTFIRYVPREKILLGVPFYGYGWQTTSRDAQAQTYPDSGFTASYDFIQSLLAQREELQLQEHWNEDALSPYVSYIEDGETYVVYFENSRSISYKLDFVNQLDLGGIAIWALGYETDSRELWDVVARKVQTFENH
jgi:spore germination protein YaaH